MSAAATPTYGVALFAQHAAMLAASGVTPDAARARGYVSVDTKVRLEQLGITRTGRNVPGLLVPQRRVDGSVWGFQYRPDQPRVRDGRPVKYETPTGQRNGLDVPPGVATSLGDPAVPLWVTEGVKKADAAAVAGLCCVALPGVWSWRGSNGQGGRTALPDWHDVALDGRRVVLAFDSDVQVKPTVRRALDALAGYLSSKGAAVEHLHLPHRDDGKTGLDDHLAAGATVEELWALVRPDPPTVVEPNGEPQLSTAVDSSASSVAPRTLDQVHATFTRWLGADYDLDVLDVVLAVAAAERLSGDPPWLLVVSGPGAAKTETVMPLAGAGALVTSTITSEGALLSATSYKERTKEATGGLLREIGGRGILVVKDVTSILAADRNQRAAVLAALREVYDGTWVRKVGTDGGRSLSWSGRVVLVGAVTTAWDKAHAVVAAMGDRFLLVRMDSTSGRVRSGRHASANTGTETTMRAELAAGVTGLLATVDPGADLTLTGDDVELLLRLADVVTLARTAVETDPRGDVVDVHAPEMPTRFAKQLTQLVRGALAVGISRERALSLAIRCARDSVPPLRLAVLLDVHAHPDSTTHAVRRRLDRPRLTVDRVLQALHMLELVTVDESEEPHGAGTRSVWRYSVPGEIDSGALALLQGSSGNVTTPTQPHCKEQRSSQSEPPCTPPHKAGTTPSPVECSRCGAGLLLDIPGREVCEPCRLDPERNAT